MAQTMNSETVYAICPAMTVFGRFASAAKPSTRPLTAWMTAIRE